MTYSREQFESAVRSVDPRCELVEARVLEGGASAQVFLLRAVSELRGEFRVVLRMCSESLMENDADALAREFAVLKELGRAGSVPIPEPYYLDVSRTLFPYPWFIMQYVEADPPPVADSCACTFAEQLLAIHRTIPSRPLYNSLPDIRDLPASLCAADIQDLRPEFPVNTVREILRDGIPHEGPDHPVLLHGDFWPGNVLWKNGRIVAVIDWEDAATGDPLFDVANARLEVMWSWGTEAMAVFTDCYVQGSGRDDCTLPYWDLIAALKALRGLPLWGLDESREAVFFSQLQGFVCTAIGRL